MDDINYKNLINRIENFYNSDESGHDYRLNNAEEIITRWLEKGLFKKLGSPRNVYDLIIQLDLRGY